MVYPAQLVGKTASGCQPISEGFARAHRSSQRDAVNNTTRNVLKVVRGNWDASGYGKDGWYPPTYVVPNEVADAISILGHHGAPTEPVSYTHLTLPTKRIV